MAGLPIWWPADWRVHELSLCDAIVEAVTRHAGGRPVRSVHLRIGHLRQVVPESLEFYWDMRTDSTELAGCRLMVEHVAAVIRCRDCGQQTTLTEPIRLCGACDRADVELLCGDEFLIDSINVSDAP